MGDGTGKCGACNKGALTYQPNSVVVPVTQVTKPRRIVSAPRRSERLRKKPETVTRFDDKYLVEIENISKKRRKSRENSRKSKETCPRKKQKVGKRKPDPPEGETKNQIKFINTFATERDGCTCYERTETQDIEDKSEEEEMEEDDFPFKDNCYDTLEEAEWVVKQMTGPHGKGQRCNAYSVLEKSGKFLVLVTSSSHHNSNEQVTNEEVEKKKGEEGPSRLKMVRPQKEPELASSFEGSKDYTRYYAIQSCDQCEEDVESTDFTESIIVNAKTTKDTLVSDPILTGILKDRDRRVSLAKDILTTASHFNKRCRIVFIKQIQPNEKVNASVKRQEGWSLHHSEMEVLFFARRRGWEVVNIYIDRDCCKTCAAALGRVDSEVHDKIKIFG